MNSLQDIGLAALILNDQWQEVRQQLQWNSEVFITFRLLQAGRASNNHQEMTVLHLLSSKGEKCPVDLLEAVLTIAPALATIHSETLLQWLIEHRRWEIVLRILQLFPETVHSCHFATRQQHTVSTLHLLCLRYDRDVTCPPMNLVDDVLETAPEWLEWKSPGTPMHYAVHACCLETDMSSEQLKWLDLLEKLLVHYPAGIAIKSSEPLVPNARNCGCITPLVLAIYLGASPKSSNSC